MYVPTQKPGIVPSPWDVPVCASCCHLGLSCTSSCVPSRGAPSHTPENSGQSGALGFRSWQQSLQKKGLKELPPAASVPAENSGYREGPTTDTRRWLPRTDPALCPFQSKIHAARSLSEIAIDLTETGTLKTSKLANMGSKGKIISGSSGSLLSSGKW